MHGDGGGGGGGFSGGGHSGGHVGGGHSGGGRSDHGNGYQNGNSFNPVTSTWSGRSGRRGPTWLRVLWSFITLALFVYILYIQH